MQSLRKFKAGKVKGHRMNQPQVSIARISFVQNRSQSYLDEVQNQVRIYFVTTPHRLLDGATCGQCALMGVDTQSTGAKGDVHGYKYSKLGGLAVQTAQAEQSSGLK